jgi:surface protein
MKSIKQHILERLVLTKNKKSQYTLFPKTKDELKQMIRDEIGEQGFNCDLNHIDVSNITDMSYLFKFSKFNGDISKWNVSKVENMSGMFWNSKFNRDISNWKINPECVTYDMFYRSSIKEEYKPK